MRQGSQPQKSFRWVLWLAGLALALRLLGWLQSYSRLQATAMPTAVPASLPSPAPTKGPTTAPPTYPIPIPDSYLDHVGSLNRFRRSETAWTYDLTYGFIDHHGRAHEISCEVSRLEHAQEIDRFGYDETEVDTLLDQRLQAEVDRQLSARGLQGLVTMAVRGPGSFKIVEHLLPSQPDRLPAVEEPRLFYEWVREVYPLLREQIERALLEERGLHLEGDRLSVDYALVASRATRPLADCFRALEREVGSDTERQRLGLFIAFLQEIRYEVPPDVASGKRTLGLFVPTEVLVNDHGDCDSKAVTFAALWRNLNSPLLLIHLPQHMLVGVSTRPGPGERFVRLGNRYFVLCEVAGPAKLHPGLQSIPDQFEYVLVEPASADAPPLRGSEGVPSNIRPAQAARGQGRRDHDPGEKREPQDQPRPQRSFGEAKKGE